MKYELPTQTKEEIILIDRVLANEYLKGNQGNRRQRTLWVKELADRMLNGKWVYNGDAIRFSKEGRLLDGQHRLEAVVIAGISVPMRIVRHLSESAFTTMDEHARRSTSDTLCRLGIGHRDIERIAATATKWWFNYRDKTFGKEPRRSNHEYFAFVSSTKEIIYSATFVHELKCKGRLLPAGPAAFLHYVASRNSKKDEVEAFIRKLYIGNDLSDKNPILHLREILSSNQESRRKLCIRDRVLMVVKVWNSMQRGRPISRKPNIYLRDNERTFPEIL